MKRIGILTGGGDAPGLNAVIRAANGQDFVYEHVSPRGTCLFQGKDRDHAAARAVIGELHGAVDLGEERVVLAEPDVEAGTELASALAHEDRAAGDDVAVEPLDAEALRIAVAPVPGTVLSFFGCHG